jgi:hypothetical protein
MLPPLNALVASELADQIEQIRITPETMTIEDVSKLWMAIQSHYRPTAGYQASVVLIESKRSARSALPVANDKRRIFVVPFRLPAIYDVVNTLGDREPIAVGSTIAIRGRDLVGDPFVNLRSVEIVPSLATMTPDRIDSDRLATSCRFVRWRQGIQSFNVAMGDPLVDHRGTNRAASFVLRPTITNGPLFLPPMLSHWFLLPKRSTACLFNCAPARCALCSIRGCRATTRDIASMS